MSKTTQSPSTFRPSGPAVPPPWRVLACSAALVAVDFATGPHYTLSVLFVLPVISAAWYQGLRFACALAVGLSVMRFLCNWGWGFPLDINPALINNVLRGITLLLVAFLTNQLAAQMHKIKRRQHRLELRLPVCPACGLACREDGQWIPLDETSRLSTTQPPRSLCPDCERKHYDVQPG
jgi:hypothetical protein